MKYGLLEALDVRPQRYSMCINCDKLKLSSNPNFLDMPSYFDCIMTCTHLKRQLVLLDCNHSSEHAIRILPRAAHRVPSQHKSLIHSVIKRGVFCCLATSRPRLSTMTGRSGGSTVFALFRLDISTYSPNDYIEFRWWGHVTCCRYEQAISQISSLIPKTFFSHFYFKNRQLIEGLHKLIYTKWNLQHCNFSGSHQCNSTTANGLFLYSFWLVCHSFCNVEDSCPSVVCVDRIWSKGHVCLVFICSDDVVNIIIWKAREIKTFTVHWALLGLPVI